MKKEILLVRRLPQQVAHHQSVGKVAKARDSSEKKSKLSLGPIEVSQGLAYLKGARAMMQSVFG